MTVVIEAPSAVTFAEGQTAREARLLVAGAYPAKKLTVTEADLDRLAANFSDPVPVKVEHIDSPLDPLGLVTRVWRTGAELRGEIMFPAEMAQFLARRDAHKLSVGLVPEPEWRLLEASLTRTPHVPTATLLSDGERAELGRLRQEVRRQRVDAQVAALKAQGRLLPAGEALARVLLSAEADAVVTLSDGATEPVAETFRRFLEAQPPQVRFGEAARAQAGTRLSGPASAAAASEEETAFSDEEQALLARLGVTPEAVRRTLAGEARAGKGRM